MTTDEKPNVVQLTYKEIFKINPLSTQFSHEDYKRVLMNPAYRRLLLEIKPTSMKGPYEIVTCSIIRKEEVIDYICERFPEEKTGDVFELVLLQGFYAVNNGVRTFMHTGLHWLNSEGVCGTYGYERDDIPDEVHKHMSIHTQDTFYAFMGIQQIMLNENEFFQVRKEYRKELKPDQKNRVLQGPFSKPGKVRLLTVKPDFDEVMEKMTREYKEYVRHCPAWGVRGHYRHMKSGKTVYVKPHVKGQRRDLYVGRIYELIQEE